MECNVCKKEIKENQIESDYMGIKAHKSCVDKRMKEMGYWEEFEEKVNIEEKAIYKEMEEG